MGKTDSKDMELVISHFEGCAGNFIAHLYANKNFEILKTFRVDVSTYSHICTIEGRNDWHTELKACKDHEILVSHQFDKDLIQSAFPNTRHIAIWPYTKQMNVLWNICHKKLSAHQIHNIDHCYINLKEWHNKLNSHIPSYECFDYGRLSDIDYVEYMLNTTLESDQQQFFKEYWLSQNNLNLTWPSNAMSIPEIIKWYHLENNITKWGVALVLYTFESVNGLQESQRKWSIDNITGTDWDEIVQLQLEYYNLPI